MRDKHEPEAYIYGICMYIHIYITDFRSAVYQNQNVFRDPGEEKERGGGSGRRIKFNNMPEQN